MPFFDCSHPSPLATRQLVPFGEDQITVHEPVPLTNTSTIRPPPESPRPTRYSACPPRRNSTICLRSEQDSSPPYKSVDVNKTPAIAVIDSRMATSIQGNRLSFRSRADR